METFVDCQKVFNSVSAALIYDSCILLTRYEDELLLEYIYLSFLRPGCDDFQSGSFFESGIKVRCKHVYIIRRVLPKDPEIDVLLNGARCNETMLCTHHWQKKSIMVSFR
jgi:hypothetical protein